MTPDLRMMSAINHCDYAAFLKAYADGADVNYVSTADDLVSGNDRTTPLIESAFRLSDEIFNHLATHPDIKVNVQNAGGTSALMMAVTTGDEDRVTALLSRGANILHRDIYGDGVVEYAEFSQQNHIIPFLKREIKKASTALSPKTPGGTPAP